VSRLVGLVADYGPGDLRFAETVQRLALLAPEVRLSPVRVADGDTLAAGLCVADLALSPGPPDRVVVHDVAAQARDRCVWFGRTRDGTLVVGADRGYAWSFVAPRLRDLCALDVPADAELTLVIRHALAGHPHALCGAIDRTRVPPSPECVLVWTDAAGRLQTTLAKAPGDRLVVQIGECREPARLRDPRQALGDGELVLEPGTHGLHRLTLGGGRAADRFGAPAVGTPVTVTAAGR
jgi:hypothetical protein